jgi:hypothetical protein
MVADGFEVREQLVEEDEQFRQRLRNNGRLTIPLGMTPSTPPTLQSSTQT